MTPLTYASSYGVYREIPSMRSPYRAAPLKGPMNGKRNLVSRDATEGFSNNSVTHSHQGSAKDSTR